MRENEKPICLFDSGLGGITVLDGLVSCLPNENFVYVADRKYCPYGTREDNYIIKRVAKITEFLQNFTPKAIVIACNTASRFIDLVRDISKVFVTDVITPTVGYVNKVTATKRVVIFATESTVRGRLYQNKLQSLGVTCEAVSCSEFLPYIENKEVFTDRFYSLVKSKLDSVRLNGYDVVVYGCTHFGLVDDIIKSYLPKSVKTVSCETATSEVVKNSLTYENLLNSNFTIKDNRVMLYTTSTTESFKTALSFYGKAYKNIKVVNID